ncbi:hypothetical protein DBR06_SOUSAS7510019, partial [Sousa chinensis]
KKIFSQNAYLAQSKKKNLWWMAEKTGHIFSHITYLFQPQRINTREESSECIECGKVHSN